MEMTPAGFALRNEKIIIFAVVVLALLGVRAAFVTPQAIFPTMSFARIDVVADAGDLPPDQVRIAVTRPLEAALQALPSVTDVVATSSQGSAELVVSFDASTDAAADLQIVDQAIAQVRASVPSATGIVAVAVNPNREPVLSYALTSPDLSQTVLRQFALAAIAPGLAGTPGLGHVLVAGGPTAEYHVVLDPAQLAAAGISASDVGKALADATTVQGAGMLQREGQRYAVLVDGSIADAASLGRISIPTSNGASVPLASLGTIRLGVSPIADQTSIDGTRAVVVNAYALPGADTVKMANGVRARLATIAPSLPRDVSLRLFWDQTTLITASQVALRDAIALGALLATLVIYAFLRSFRLTLVAAAVIPLALALAIFALGLAGQTLNLMSVGGLAVAVGLIIDDAIVVIENIARNRAAHPEWDGTTAIEASMKQLSGAMIASTATTVVVFIPLALLTGVTGFFFRALAFTLSVSLVVSLGLALAIAPIVARRLLAGERSHGERRDAIAAVLDRYEPLLRWSLGHRAIVAAASSGVLLLTLALLARLPSDFLPAMDEGQFEIAYAVPVGTTLAASNAAATAMERIVAADPAVDAVGRLTGIDSNGLSPTQPNQGLLRVRLKPPGERASYDDVSARLRDRLAAAVPAAVFDYHQILEDLINDLSGTPAPIEITLRGADQSTLIGLAGGVAHAIAAVPGVVDASPGVTYDNPSLRIAPRGAALAALGLSARDVGDAVAALGQGSVVAGVPGAQAQIPVRVQVGGEGAWLDAATPLYAKGVPTALGDVAQLSQQRLASDILTENGQLQVRVTANLANARLSDAIDGIRATLRGIPMPPGYTATIGGQYASQATSFRQFQSVIGIAIALVFAVMLATFRSYRLPLVVLTAIPLALIGVALGLTLTGTPVNVSSFMGLLLLVGVVVKNGILLIDVANRERLAGASIEDALVVAGRTRLRPIVMTTLAAIGGLFPLALGLGQGAEMERPLAIAVIGGLSTATIFTLIVIPVLYQFFAGRIELRAPGAAPAAALALIAWFAVVPHIAAAQNVDIAPAASIDVFASLSLEDAERDALATSPDVRAAAARLEQSRLAYAIARAGAAPAFVASYAQTPQGNPPGPNVISRQVNAQVQWSLSDYLGLSPAAQEAALTLGSDQASEAAAEATERQKTIGLYYDALRARSVAAARRRALALADAQRSAAAVRTGAGDAPRLDVMRADVALAHAQADLETALADDANAREALRAESGVSDALLAVTVARAPVPVNPALTNPAAVAELARRQRTEVRAAQLTADAADAAVRGARAAGIPATTVGAGYVIGTDSGVPVSAPSISANFTIPLSGIAHDRVALALAKAVEARAKAAAVERSVTLDAAASARTLAAAERAAAATTRERQAAGTALAATEIGYRNGASSSLDVTIARAAFEQATIDELNATYDLEKARATLAVEVGV